MLLVEYAEVNLDEQTINAPRSSPSNRPPATTPPDVPLQKTNDGTGDMQSEISTLFISTIVKKNIIVW